MTMVVEERSVAVPVAAHRNAIPREATTWVANTPDFIRGGVNLPGAIVPVIEIRLTLACESVELRPLVLGGAGWDYHLNAVRPKSTGP